MEAVIARVTVMTVTVIWRQLLPDWKSEMNELVDVHMFWCLYIYVSGVCVYNYVSGAGIYMLLVRGVCMCLMFAFCIKFVRFLNIVFVVLFCLKKIGGGGIFRTARYP